MKIPKFVLNKEWWRPWICIIMFAILCKCQLDWKCITKCKCIWMSGKKTADCKNQNMTKIPDGLSKEIQYLDASGNSLTYLPDKVFALRNLENLQKLVLRKCEIEVLSIHSFVGLQIVIDIDISYNLIRNLPKGIFDETKRLRTLLLNNNRLERLEYETFHDLLFLQKIDFTNNYLFYIDTWTFRNLPNLQILLFENNNLTKLSMHSFSHLPKLSVLEIGHNPWHCDCQLRDFRDWVLRHKILSQEPTCVTPNQLIGLTWNEVNSNIFACLPVIEDIGWHKLPFGGLELWCRLSNQSQAQLFWIMPLHLTINSTHQENNGLISQLFTSDTENFQYKSGYVVSQKKNWINLTIFDPGSRDNGDYVCLAKNLLGSIERNISLSLDLYLSANDSHKNDSKTFLMIASVALIIFFFLFVLFFIFLCFYRRRSVIQTKEKSQDTVSFSNTDFVDQEESLITTINPLVKPPRRYDALSEASHNTEITELSRTLLEKDITFGDNLNNVLGLLETELQQDEHNYDTNELDFTPNQNENRCNSIIDREFQNVPLSASFNVKYGPDLLTFLRFQNLSTASKLASFNSHQHWLNLKKHYSRHSPMTGEFNLLPNAQNLNSKTLDGTLNPQSLSIIQHGFITIPRRPRTHSWSVSPELSCLREEPLNDNLGLRKTADGISLISIRESLDLKIHTATSNLLSSNDMNILTLPRTSRSPANNWRHNIDVEMARVKNSSEKNFIYSTSTILPPNKCQPITTNSQFILKQRQLSSNLINDMLIENVPTAIDSKRLTGDRFLEDKDSQFELIHKKIPPRPPPKPKNGTHSMTVYEDEEEDGTEV